MCSTFGRDPFSGSKADVDLKVSFSPIHKQEWCERNEVVDV